MFFDLHHNERDCLLSFVPRDVSAARKLQPILPRLMSEQTAGKRYELILKNISAGAKLERRCIVLRDYELPFSSSADMSLEIYRDGWSMTQKSIEALDRLFNQTNQQQCPVGRLFHIGQTVENYPTLVLLLDEPCYYCWMNG